MVFACSFPAPVCLREVLGDGIVGKYVQYPSVAHGIEAARIGERKPRIHSPNRIPMHDLQISSTCFLSLFPVPLCSLLVCGLFLCLTLFECDTLIKHRTHSASTHPEDTHFPNAHNNSRICQVRRKLVSRSKSPSVLTLQLKCRNSIRNERSTSLESVLLSSLSSLRSHCLFCSQPLPRERSCGLTVSFAPCTPAPSTTPLVPSSRTPPLSQSTCFTLSLTLFGLSVDTHAPSAYAPSLTYLLTCCLPPVLTPSGICLLPASCPCLLTHSLTHSLTSLLPASCAHSFTHSLPHSLTHSRTRLLPAHAHSLTATLTHCHTHSLPHSLTATTGVDRREGRHNGVIASRQDSATQNLQTVACIYEGAAHSKRCPTLMQS